MKCLTIFIPVFLLLFSCGGGDDDSPQPSPGGQDIGSAALQEFNQTVSPVLQKSCAGASCHTSGTARDAIITSADGLLKSRADQLVAANKMPKPGSPQAEAFTGGDKQVILNFIQKYKNAR